MAKPILHAIWETGDPAQMLESGVLPFRLEAAGSLSLGATVKDRPFRLRDSVSPAISMETARPTLPALPVLRGKFGRFPFLLAVGGILSRGVEVHFLPKNGMSYPSQANASRQILMVTGRLIWLVLTVSMMFGASHYQPAAGGTPDHGAEAP
jgi:hypothetical protein